MFRNAWALVLVAAALPIGALITTPAVAQQKAAAAKVDPKQVERGRYLVKIAGCNDCHTAGYALSGGKVPEAQWLTGDKLGWQGPWGTTYASNLRLYMANLNEGQWVKTAKSLQARPPMPWFALHDMTEQDLKAIYHYVAHLGPAGELAPAYVPPGGPVKTPVVTFPAPPK